MICYHCIRIKCDIDGLSIRLSYVKTIFMWLCHKCICAWCDLVSFLATLSSHQNTFFPLLRFNWCIIVFSSFDISFRLWSHWTNSKATDKQAPDLIGSNGYCDFGDQPSSSLICVEPATNVAYRVTTWRRYGRLRVTLLCLLLLFSTLKSKPSAVQMCYTMWNKGMVFKKPLSTLRFGPTAE